MKAVRFHSSRIWTYVSAAVAASLLCACITVNINFPAAEIEEEAEKIIDEVRSPELEAHSASQEEEGREQPADERPEIPEQGAFLATRNVFIALVESRPAYAEEPSEDEDDEGDNDPVVQKIKKTLKERYPQLLPFYNKGALGENRQALLEARETEKLSLKEKGELKKLIAAENKDRMNLYKRIAVVKGVDPSRIKDIQTIFARQWIDKAKAGWWVQDEKGKWAKKAVKRKK